MKEICKIIQYTTKYSAKGLIEKPLHDVQIYMSSCMFGFFELPVLTQCCIPFELYEGYNGRISLIDPPNHY